MIETITTWVLYHLSGPVTGPVVAPLTSSPDTATPE